MVPWLRRIYPLAACALIAALVLLGDGALLIMGMALVIACIPLGFAPESDEIARDMRRTADQRDQLEPSRRN